MRQGAPFDAEPVDSEAWAMLRDAAQRVGVPFGEWLKAKLLATGTKRIVEASPRDRIWGIGFGAKNALNKRGQWGQNLLGRALEETRKELNRGNN